MKSKTTNATNLDFCVKSNLTAEQMVLLQKKLGFTSADKFLSAKCGFVPQFKVGDILVGPTGERNFVVSGYDEDDFTYSLFDVGYIGEFRLGGYRTEAHSITATAYATEKKYCCWGHIDASVMKYVDAFEYHGWN